MPRLRRGDYDQAVTTASPQSEPDVLTVGLGEAGRLSRRGKFVLVAIVLALLAGLMVWRFLPARAPLFSLSDVQGVYAGMVRSDGTNSASVIDRRWSSEQDGYIVPAACGPLFEATVLNRAPPEALDGVSTFWEIDRSAVSLFTYRFADVAKADREFNRLATVLDNCDQAHVEVHARPASRGLLTRTPLAPDSDPPAQIGYVLTNNAGAKLAIHVLAFSNTVSWQFRYEPVPGTYLPLTAQRRDGLAGGSDACSPGLESLAPPGSRLVQLSVPVHDVAEDFQLPSSLASRLFHIGPRATQFIGKVR